MLLSHCSGEYLSQVDSRVNIRSAMAERVRYSSFWFVREANRYPNAPILGFGVEIGCMLGLLKRIGLIRSPVIYREGSLPEANVPARELWKYRELIAHVDVFIAQSHFASESLCKLGISRSRLNVIPNMYQASTRHFGDAPNIRAKGTTTLLAVARLEPEKRIAVLLKSFAKAVQSKTHWRLYIAGAGKLEAELKLLAKELKLDGKVRFLGFVRDVEVLYKQADVFIMTSAYEGLPNALIEAIACGCRAVASGGGGVRELLEKLSVPQSYLEEDDISEGLARKVDELLKMPDAIWENGRRRLKTITRPEAVAQAYLRVCTKAARGENPLV
jgi:glycosyltransferase involved in cell wall biosynthesis